MNDKTELKETPITNDDNTANLTPDEKRKRFLEKLEEEKEKKKTQILNQRLKKRQLIRGILNNWLNDTPYYAFLEAVKSRVLGQEDVELIVANIYNYISVLACQKKPNHNMLLAAPSGCGKTEIYRALRDYFKEEIPGFVVAQVDMTQITEQGFKGSDTNEIVTALFERSEWEGIGIIFLDEFDKKLIPSYSSGGSNVNLAVQHQILTLLEGRLVRDKEGGSVNTELTMFIGLGAYDMCRKTAQEESKMGIGFSAVGEKQYDYYNSISSEDMINLGASYELIGRFPMIVNFHKLSPEIIDIILDRKLVQYSEFFGYKVTVEDDYRKTFYEMADSKYGCRMIDSIIYREALGLYSKALYAEAFYHECEFVLNGNGGKLHWLEGTTETLVENYYRELDNRKQVRDNMMWY